MVENLPRVSSIETYKERIYAGSGSVFYVPGFGLQEDVAIMFDGRKLAPFERFKLMYAKNRWSPYLYAGIGLKEMYDGNVQFEETLAAPSHPGLLESARLQPIISNAPEQSASQVILMIEYSDVVLYAQVLRDLLQGFTLTSFELISQGEVGTKAVDGVIENLRRLLAVKSISAVIELKGSVTAADRKTHHMYTMKRG